MNDQAQLDAVRCEPEGERWTLVFVRDLRHPPERVWTALTDPEQLSAWAPYTADRSLAQPGDATLTMFAGTPDAEDQALPASVTRADPPRLLEHSFGEDLLRWELEPADAGTRLTLGHTLTDRDWAPAVAAGWHLCFDVAERLLDGRPVPPIRGEAAKQHGWDALRDRYADRLDVSG
jgi:uncharacterized protein YndB with AHSA1/START domain